MVGDVARMNNTNASHLVWGGGEQKNEKRLGDLGEDRGKKYKKGKKKKKKRGWGGGGQKKKKKNPPFVGGGGGNKTTKNALEI